LGENLAKKIKKSNFFCNLFDRLCVLMSEIKKHPTIPIVGTSEKEGDNLGELSLFLLSG
jgi:hypothetical protein